MPQPMIITAISKPFITPTPFPVPACCIYGFLRFYGCLVFSCLNHSFLSRKIAGRFLSFLPAYGLLHYYNM
jgi:hypothetical protein